MISLKYSVCVATVACLAVLIFSGCGSKGTTTKFRLTPIERMEDSTTDPESLARDLDVLLQSEDAKRMKMLQEEARAGSEAEKEGKPSIHKAEETK